MLFNNYPDEETCYADLIVVTAGGQLLTALARPVAKIISYRTRKHVGRLHHHAYSTPQLSRGKLSEVPAIKVDRASGWFVPVG